MRVLFLGSPGRFTARALWGCLDAGDEICEFWYGHRIRKNAWRGDRQLGWFNPGWSVSAALKQHQISTRPVPPLRTAVDLWRRAERLGADVMVSAAFPYTVPAELLQLFPDRAVNLHPALLPAYRGPYPLFGMMFRNEVDRCGGVTLHQMVPELDAGPIIAQEPTPWNSRGFRHWEADLGRATYRLANVALPRYLQGAIQPRAQQADSDVYFRNVDSELLQINRDRTAERAKYLLDSIGSYTPLRAHVGERSWRVSGFLEILADHPLGTPPRISSWRIEMDVSDARIALRRWIPFTSKLRRWNTFRLFARIQDAA